MGIVHIFKKLGFQFESLTSLSINNSLYNVIKSENNSSHVGYKWIISKVNDFIKLMRAKLYLGICFKIDITEILIWEKFFIPDVYCLVVGTSIARVIFNFVIEKVQHHPFLDNRISKL